MRAFLTKFVNLLFLCGLLTTARAAEESVRFAVCDVFIDPQGESLAAYQLSLSASGTKIISIEGGNHPAFDEPPFHDPEAVQNSRVILAAFSTSPASALPNSTVRVASIHIQVLGKAAPVFKVEMQKAGNAEAELIPVRVVVQERISTD